MAEIAKAIQTNIDAIKDKQAEAVNVNSSKAELHKKLKVPTVGLKTFNLEYPRTVCTVASCVDLVSVGSDGKQETHYKTICHDRCQITTDKNVLRCAELQECWAMQISIDECRVCKCPWYIHMHITYDMAQETVYVEDQSVKKLIDEKDGSIKAIKAFEKQLDEKMNQLNYEKKRLAEVNARFACFLKHNAIAPYNDAMLEYLNHIIENEKMKVGVGISPKTLEGLVNTRAVYQEEIKAIEEATEGKTSKDPNLDIETINKLMEQLKSLPIVGGMLKDVMSGVREANEKATQFNEKHVDAPPKDSKKGTWKFWKHFY